MAPFISIGSRVSDHRNRKRHRYLDLVAWSTLYDSIRDVVIEFRKVFLQLHCLESICICGLLEN